MADPLNVGVIGCGNICGAYFDGCKRFGRVIRVVACADLIAERADEAAKKHAIDRACSVEELLADDTIDIVLNLTIPAAHAEVNLAAIEAGKHVHCEKPFALSLADGERVLAAAASRGVRVGCAPDTFLGGGAQTARKLIDDGAIGEPVAATALWVSHGHEHWHPAPQFFYQPGGGPMLDMGPYYLTALVNLMGPAARVCGYARTTFSQRTITSEPLDGTVVNVEVPTHYAGTIEFANGAVATVITSFDVWKANLPLLEVYGTEGSLSLPDPNRFTGPVRIARGRDDWQDVPLTHTDQISRGAGVADMAYGLLHDRGHRASGRLACHVLDVMTAFERAGADGRYVELATTCEQPAALPPGLAPGELDA